MCCFPICKDEESHIWPWSVIDFVPLRPSKHGLGRTTVLKCNTRPSEKIRRILA